MSIFDSRDDRNRFRGIGDGRTRGFNLAGSSTKYGVSDLGLIFNAPLQTSLVPNYAFGNPSPTFTRATTAYVQDWEGLFKQTLSGEARFQGARRVYNTLTMSSEDFTTWNKDTGVVVSGSEIDPSGGSTAYKVVYSGGGSGGIFSNNSGGTFSRTTSCWLRGLAGGEVITLGNTSTVTLTTGWKRYSVTDAAIDGFLRIRLPAGTPGTFYAWRAQQEIVTGQSNQNPSEYVSVGVLSAPYQGAGVDGVKYFNYLNGNTVTNNVVTEAAGAMIITGTSGVSALTVDAGGPFGYLAEGLRTNVILQSQTLDNASWTVSNATDMNAVTADQYVAPDGTTTMDLLKPKATTAVHSLNQAFTFTAAIYTTSIYLRYVPATPQRWVALVMNDGTTTWAASFDLLNGLAGAVSNATSTITATNFANVYRVTVTKSANAAAAPGTMKISLNTTDTATLESSARAGTETLGAWGAQLEAAAFASTYIPTTTVAVPRNADILLYPSSGNIVNATGTVYLEVTSNPSIPNNTTFLATYNGSGGIPAAFNTNSLALYDNTTYRTGQAFTPSLSVQKIATSWGGSSGSSAVSGAVSALSGFDGSIDANTNISIGVTQDTNGPLFGTARNVRIYNKALTDSQLQSMTT